MPAPNLIPRRAQKAVTNDACFGPIRVASEHFQRERGVRDVRRTTCADDSNGNAARSYQAYGFVETGQQRAMDRNPRIIQIELAYPF